MSLEAGSGSGKPFSEACEQNWRPILEVIRSLFTDTARVLEIGSGTGQHAVRFGAALPTVQWQTSDLRARHAGIGLWLQEADLVNVLAPIDLDVTGQWPTGPFDAVFSANTAHILSRADTEAMIRGVAGVLRRGGQFVLYGPFNYGGAFTSASNARFDRWLKARDPLSGIKDFEVLDRIAGDCGMVLQFDVVMPANNRTLVWSIA